MTFWLPTRFHCQRLVEETLPQIAACSWLRTVLLRSRLQDQLQSKPIEKILSIESLKEKTDILEL
jgi:hypothetical protein